MYLMVNIINYKIVLELMNTIVLIASLIQNCGKYIKPARFKKFIQIYF